jgi:hypothetical protein
LYKQLDANGNGELAKANSRPKLCTSTTARLITKRYRKNNPSIIDAEKVLLYDWTEIG